MFDWIGDLLSGIGDAISGAFQSLWEVISSSIWDIFLKWIYEAIYGAIADFFTMMGNMGADMFNLPWVVAIVKLFSMFGWALFVAGLVVAVFDTAIEYQSMGRVNIKRQIMPVLYGFLAVNLFTTIPIELYKLCLTLQNLLSHDLSSIFGGYMVDSGKGLAQAATSALTRKSEITEYPLSGKIGCGDCGSYYRRRVVRGVPRWACAMHVKNADSCNSHYIGEDRIYDGFIAVVNKLKYSDTDILEQTERSLETAILFMKKQNSDVMQINRQISDLNAKLLMIEQLRIKGYIALEVYHSQANEITNELTKLKSKRQSAYESKLENELKNIQTLRKRITEISEPLTAFDELLFNETVEAMTLNNNDELTVTFIGGISFTEII